MTGQRKQNFIKLEKIANLADNWNGYGASPFDPEYIAYVREIVKQLSRQPEIFPLPYGSVQFEYDKANGDHLEFELNPDGTASVFILLKDSVPATMTIPADKINHCIQTFFE